MKKLFKGYTKMLTNLDENVIFALAFVNKNNF